MIRYALRCKDGHQFEAWFQNSAAFDRQAARGQVSCPQCGSAKVSKAVMAPNIASNTPSPERVRAALKELREHVTANAEYVGDRFASEARKIHHEETEARGIYGEATPEEVKELNEEGVEVYPLLPAPEDSN
ncbi:MAG: DUF1178 family protein [Hyphomicrobiales bacterium]